LDWKVTLQKHAGALNQTFWALVQHSAGGVETLPAIKEAHFPSSAYAVVLLQGSVAGGGSFVMLSLQE